MWRTSVAEAANSTAAMARCPSGVPNFVSLKERYKRTPELVREAVQDVPRAERVALNLARIDTLETFGDVDGV